MKIALVTYQDKGAYHNIAVANEDEQLLSFLRSKGLVIEKVIWNDPTIKWKQYDLAILKSPWDYFDLIDDFYAWLNLLEHENIRLLNPLDIVRWNADKHYLHDIEKAGLNVTPSVFIHQGEKVELTAHFKSLKTETLIIKPVVSGGSKNTFKITEANVEEISLKLTELLKLEDFIVQPFLPEIETNGEWSLLFFGGKFSHALLKKAKEGDFRVQATFGGTVHPQNPPSDLLDTAQKYVDHFAKGCLYTRVDGAVVNNQFMLMELELIEPFLFLESDEKSYGRYYEALKKLIN